MALIDAIPERKFLVYNKDAESQDEIVGVAALAKHLNVPENEIPPARLSKYSVGDFVVYERNRLASMD